MRPGPTVAVEPSRTQAGIIGRYLKQFGAAAVHVTAAGREGVEGAKRERAAVLICSMHLADMTGVDLARAVLADPGCGGLAVVVATSEPRRRGRPCGRRACGGLAVVVATSEADAEQATGLPTDPRVVVLRKPFDYHQLARCPGSLGGRP